MLALSRSGKQKPDPEGSTRFCLPSDLRSDSSKQAVVVLSLSPLWPSLIHLSPNRQVLSPNLPASSFLRGTRLTSSGQTSTGHSEPSSLSPPPESPPQSTRQRWYCPPCPWRTLHLSLPSHQDTASVLKGSTLHHENLSRLGPA